MIDVKILNNNTIITLSSPGKSPIKSSSGLYFYSPADLLCSAIGSCVGREIVLFCAGQRIDVGIFQSLSVDYINYKMIVKIQHPRDMSESIVRQLRHRVAGCDMVAKISKAITIDIDITPNTMSNNEIRGVVKSKGCCGG